MESKTNRDNSRQKIDFYTLVAPFYDILVGPFLRPARKDIRRGAEAEKCRRILDVACGTGEQAIVLAKAGSDVTGIDLSPAMLGVARRKSPPNVAYFLGDAKNLPFGSGSFDCVTISLALHEMAPQTRMEVTGEMLRVLAAGGKLIVFDYAALQNWRHASGLALLGLLERIAGGEHFRNFVRFTRMGGIDHFLKAFPLKVIRSRSYFLGALRLVLSKKRQ
ncbi:MAG: class I SAM-dependent methyltransferase [Syntrophobacteraceae bacterium]|jgi:ubiquinone/menaquinone biosynthesis C-methylase UbiE